MIGMVMVDSRFRWGVTSIDVQPPGQMLSKMGGPVIDAGTIVLAPVSVNALGDVTGTVQYDWNNGWVFSARLIGTTTLIFLNPLNGGVYRVIIRQDGTGSRVLNLPGTVTWPGGAAPSILTAPNSLTVLHFLWDGTNYIACMDKSGTI